MKSLGMLGFAQSAGGLVSGDQAVQRALARGQVHLLLLAADASSKTRKNFVLLANRNQVPCILTDIDKEELGRAIGKPMRSVVAVTDERFAHILGQGLPGQRITGSDEYGENKDL
ncbi:MAG: L7Ae/L30e/S12e/Gadd45 family ribosomal protein [Limnochordia bacterium]|jgi:ribosomal protein L7Ae-like RNA K-turn-binding protein